MFSTTVILPLIARTILQMIRNESGFANRISNEKCTCMIWRITPRVSKVNVNWMKILGSKLSSAEERASFLRKASNKGVGVICIITKNQWFCRQVRIASWHEKIFTFTFSRNVSGNLLTFCNILDIKQEKVFFLCEKVAADETKAVLLIIIFTSWMFDAVFWCMIDLKLPSSFRHVTLTFEHNLA